MNLLTTQGITVRVDAFYQFGESRPIEENYIKNIKTFVMNNDYEVD